MNINELLINKYFKVGDKVLSGGGLATYEIIEILDDRVRIKPTKAKTKSRLFYDRISCIIERYDHVDPDKIEESVGSILSESGMQDTQNESYLYGFARELLKRTAPISREVYENDLDERVENAKNDTSENRKNRLKNANKKPGRLTVNSVGFKRNQDVIAEVLFRANGKCEECGKTAPFLRASDGSPYLEVHHVLPLSENGDDTVENTLALCPNCHRQAHFG